MLQLPLLLVAIWYLSMDLVRGYKQKFLLSCCRVFSSFASSLFISNVYNPYFIIKMGKVRKKKKKEKCILQFMKAIWNEIVFNLFEHQFDFVH